MSDTEGNNPSPVAPASTPTPAPKPSFFAALAANWKKILLAVLVFVFHILASSGAAFFSTLAGHLFFLLVSRKCPAFLRA